MYVDQSYLHETYGSETAAYSYRIALYQPGASEEEKDVREFCIDDSESFRKQMEAYAEGQLKIEDIEYEWPTMTVAPTFIHTESFDLIMPDEERSVWYLDLAVYNKNGKLLREGSGDICHGVWCGDWDYYAWIGEMPAYNAYAKDRYKDGSMTAKEAAEFLEEKNVSIIDEDLLADAVAEGFERDEWYLSNEDIELIEQELNRTGPDSYLNDDTLEGAAVLDNTATSFYQTRNERNYHVYGTFKWSNGTNTYPLNEVYGIVRYQIGSGAPLIINLGSFYTNEQGEFEINRIIGLPIHSSGLFLVTIFSKGPSICVYKMDNSFFQWTFAFSAEDLIVNGVLSDMDCGSMILNSSDTTNNNNNKQGTAEALEIHQAMRFAREYGETDYGFGGSIEVKYGYNDTTFTISKYSPSEDIIFIADENYQSWDTMAHELFHKMNADEGYLGCGNVGGHHGIGISLHDYLVHDDNVGVYQYGKLKACQLAWSEGVADYFAISSQNRDFDNGTFSVYEGLICRGPGLSDTYLFGDTYYKNYTSLAVYSSYYGEAYEGTVLSFLYRCTSFDRSREMVNEMLVYSNAATLSEFVNYVQENCETQLDYTRQYNLLTSLQLASNASIFDYDDYTLFYDDFYEPGMSLFEWTAGNGNSSKPNNRFIIKFFGDEDCENLLFQYELTYSSGLLSASSSAFDIAFEDIGQNLKISVNCITGYNWRDFIMTYEECTSLYWQVIEFNEYYDNNGELLTTGPYTSRLGHINFWNSLVNKPIVWSHDNFFDTRCSVLGASNADYCDIAISSTLDGPYIHYDNTPCFPIGALCSTVSNYLFNDDLIAGNRYYVKCQYINILHDYHSPWSDPVELIVSLPTTIDVQMTVLPDRFRLQWSDLEGANSYNCYLNERDLDGYDCIDFSTINNHTSWVSIPPGDVQDYNLFLEVVGDYHIRKFNISFYYDHGLMGIRNTNYNYDDRFSMEMGLDGLYYLEYTPLEQINGAEHMDYWPEPIMTWLDNNGIALTDEELNQLFEE